MNSQLVAKIHESFQTELPDLEVRKALRPGDTVNAYIKILVNKKVQKTLTTAEKQAQKKAADSGKAVETKSQPFKGIIIAKKGLGKNSKIVIRKIGADNIGVEKIVPLYSPVLEKIELLSAGKPRRAKLYYLRKRIGKMALRIKKHTKETKVPKEEETAEVAGV